MADDQDPRVLSWERIVGSAATSFLKMRVLRRGLRWERIVRSAATSFWQMAEHGGMPFIYIPIPHEDRNNFGGAGVLMHDGRALQYATEEMKNNQHVVIAAVKEDGLAMHFRKEDHYFVGEWDRPRAIRSTTSTTLIEWRRWQRKCDDFFGPYRSRYDSVLQHASDEMRNNEQVVMAAVTENGCALRFASDEMKNNHRVVIAAIKPCESRGTPRTPIFFREEVFHCKALDYASDNLKSNEDFLVDALSYNGLALEYASKEMKNNRRVVIAAIKPFPFSNGFCEQRIDMDALAFRYASHNLKRNEDFLVDALSYNGLALAFASMAMKNNRRVVIAAIKPFLFSNGLCKQRMESDARAFRYASDNLKSNEDFLVDALSYNGLALEFASEDMRNNERIVIAAITPCPVFGRIAKQRMESDARALYYASYNLKDNEDFLVDALSYNGLALEFASMAMKSNRRVVMAAIAPPTVRRAKSVAPAMEHASEELKNDPSFWQQAVATNGVVLRYAPERFRNDVDIAIAAVRQNYGAYDSVPDRIRRNKLFLRATLPI